MKGKVHALKDAKTKLSILCSKLQNSKYGVMRNC